MIFKKILKFLFFFKVLTNTYTHTHTYLHTHTYPIQHDLRGLLYHSNIYKDLEVKRDWPVVSWRWVTEWEVIILCH
jgi:hypothetical protein